MIDPMLPRIRCGTLVDMARLNPTHDIYVEGVHWDRGAIAVALIENANFFIQYLRRGDVIAQPSAASVPPRSSGSGGKG